MLNVKLPMIYEDFLDFLLEKLSPEDKTIPIDITTC
jgi:hypothetical protein